MEGALVGNDEIQSAVMRLNEALRQSLWHGSYPALERHALTLPQLRLLEVLDGTGPTSARDLVARLEVTAPTVTSTVDRLVRKGLVSRAEDAEDRRRKRIELTAEGRGIVAQGQRQGLGLIGRVVERLDDADLADLTRLLQRMVSIQAELTAEDEREPA